MKRIVVCPSCKIKMQIFDIGKEINQKCPRCKNSFDIHPVKDKGKTADKGAKEQPKDEAAKKTEPEAPKSEAAKVTEPEAPKSELPEVKEEPKSADKPADKKITIKPPTQSTAKTDASTSDKKPATDAKTAEADKPAADAKTAEADKSAVDVKAAEVEKPAQESDKAAGSLKKSKAACKPATPATPVSAPLPAAVVAGFSGMQFKILFVMLLVMIIIQLVFAKRQMTQLSIVNDNLKVIHKKL
ncbi:MAG: hypothetical protein WC340_00050 [Kiritimatiellia bacterium]